MDGILVVDKPSGCTSHDVVARVRRALKITKVGHTGTLDPMATGVLPLVLGRGTKLARYLTGGDKGYLATVRLGACTDTLDAEGKILSEHPVTATEEEVRAAVATFMGSIEQVPPMYSAKKIDGKKLYELARKGVEIEREAKIVHIHRLEVQSYEAPDLTLLMHCSAGTYVRVLAQDIGTKLGCGGFLQALRRVSAGPFMEKDAQPLEVVLQDPAAALTRVLPLEQALAGLPRLQVPPHVAKMITSGYQLRVSDLRTLDTPTFALDEAMAVAVDGGGVVAVARAQLASCDLLNSRRDTHALKTERVLSAP